MSFVQGQDWSTAGWSNKGPASGAAKAQQLNAARRQGTVTAEAKREFLLPRVVVGFCIY